MARKITPEDRKRLEAYRKKRNDMYQEGVLQRAEEEAAKAKAAKAQEAADAAAKKRQDDMYKEAMELNKLYDERAAKVKKQNEMLDSTVDLSNTLVKNANEQGGALKKQTTIHQGVLDTMQAQVEQGGITEEQLAFQVDLTEKIADGTATTHDLQMALKDNASEMTEEYKLFLEQQIKFNEQQELSNELMGEMDGALGTNLKGLTDFANMSSSAKMMAGFAAVLAILVKFSGQLDAIGEQFGAIGVQQFAGDLMAADAEMARLGYDAGSAAEVTTTLADNFGVGMTDAMGMAAATGDMSKALGLSLAEGSQLMGMFTTMGGMTPQQAEDMSKMAAQLANANNVNPSAVLKDIAGSTETFAKFGKDGGANLVEAAVVAKKLGTNLDSVASTMEGMLDFANSTTKAMEASVMVGRDINVQKLQELSLAGDAAGVLEEQKRLLGDAEAFNSMNVLQRKALAEALGLSVEEANKMVNAEKEQASLAGELAKQPGFEQLVGKEALSSLSQLMGSLQSIAAVLTNVLGPPLNIIVGIFAEGFNVINSVIDTLMEFPVIAGIVGAALALMSSKFLISAIAGVWAGVSSIMSIPFVGPVLATIAAVGLISTIYNAIAGAQSKKVGDLSTGPGGGGPVVTTPQGQQFEGSVRDEVLMAPGIAGAGAAAAGSAAGSQAVVAAVQDLKATTQTGIDSRPSAKDIGKATGNKMEELGDM